MIAIRLKDLLYKLIPPLLSKEIVSDVIFDAMIEAIKSDDGAYFDFKDFKREDIEKIYNSLVVENEDKPKKNLADGLYRGTNSLEILINNVIEGNYHHTEHLIGLGINYRINLAIEELISSGDIKIDCEVQ